MTPLSPCRACGQLTVPRTKDGHDLGCVHHLEHDDCTCPASMTATSPLEAGGHTLGSIIAEIMAEVEKATRKFPTWPTRIIDAGNVVSEEAGELAKACLQVTYEKEKETLEGARMEAIQTAAMCVRFIASMDRYDCSPGPQHQQFGYEPKYCDHCGAIKGETRSSICVPPFHNQPHQWTGKHPADVRLRARSEHTQ